MASTTRLRFRRSRHRLRRRLKYPTPSAPIFRCRLRDTRVPDGALGLQRKVSAAFCAAKRQARKNLPDSHRGANSVLDLDQRVIERVSRVRKSDPIARPDKAAQQHRKSSSEPLPAMIFDGSTPYTLRPPTARRRSAARDKAAGSLDGLSQCRINPWRWRIGIFVGVELDDSRILRLFTRHVASHCRNIGAEVPWHSGGILSAASVLFKPLLMSPGHLEDPES